MNLKSFAEYGLGNTPLCNIRSSGSESRIYLKLESSNLTGSIKARTGYYIIQDLWVRDLLRPNISLVESSSGNLGLALAYFAHDLNIHFLCLVDPTLPAEKFTQLTDAGIDYQVVSQGNSPDYRTARIRQAEYLDQLPEWIWTNQYKNPSNFAAHYETTGPEIWKQTDGDVDFVICSVGTGGTVCGVGQYLKSRKRDVTIVAVEPDGSTIFGGESHQYLSVGAGLWGPSAIINRYGNVIDFSCKVHDVCAIQECLRIQENEHFGVGITTGMALAAAREISFQKPTATVVVVAPDGGDNYTSIFSEYKDKLCASPRLTFSRANPNTISPKQDIGVFP